MAGPCAHEVNGVPCGKLGTAIIKIRQGNVSMKGPRKEDLGRGVGSCWIVVCGQHIAMYPDHEGMFLEETKQ